MALNYGIFEILKSSKFINCFDVSFWCFFMKSLILQQSDFQIPTFSKKTLEVFELDLSATSNFIDAFWGYLLGADFEDIVLICYAYEIIEEFSLRQDGVSNFNFMDLHDVCVDNAEFSFLSSCQSLSLNLTLKLTGNCLKESP